MEKNMEKNSRFTKSEVVAAILSQNEGAISEDFVVGECLFIRTITFHWTGRVSRITKQFLHLEDAAFVADSERFTDAIDKGTLKEVEPIRRGFVRISIGSIVDVCSWFTPLPREQK